MSLERLPIYKGSVHDVYFVKDIQFFIDKINSGETFSLIRFNVDFWMLIERALKNLELKWSPNISDSNLKLIADYMYGIIVRRAEERGGYYKITSAIFLNILKYIKSHKPSNFFLSISDRTYYYGSFPPTKAKWSQHIPDLIYDIIPKGETPFSSLMWKSWAKNGQIHRLFTESQEAHFVLIAPPYHEATRKKLGPNVTHLKIDSINASAHLSKTIDEVISLHKELSKKHNKIVYVCSGGAPVNWLICHLHNKLERAFFIDVGRALDVYLADEPIMSRTPKWMWGGWLTDSKPFPPKWLRNIKKN